MYFLPLIIVLRFLDFFQELLSINFLEGMAALAVDPIILFLTDHQYLVISADACVFFLILYHRKS